MATPPDTAAAMVKFTPPPLPPGFAQHHVVVLEECHCALPTLPFPHTYTGYWNTTTSQVAARIAPASILITTIVPVTSADLATAPHIQCMAIMATGMGWVDRHDFARRGITVVNCPQSNIPAVSEHWLGLYFAARKKVVEMHRLTTETDEWTKDGTLTKKWTGGPPLSSSQEVLGIIGYGSLGKRIKWLAERVGFGEILIADRKGAGSDTVREGRVPFDQVLRTSSTLVLCCPKEPETIDLIDENELKNMRREMCLINMARGGIVNEAALAKALRQGWISSAATDVLELEPVAPGSTPLLPRLDLGEQPIPNLTISPHVSWFSVKTIETLRQLLHEGVCGFVRGEIPEVNIAVHAGRIYK